MSATAKPDRKRIIKLCSVVTGDYITVHILTGPDEERAILSGVLTVDPDTWRLLFDSLAAAPGVIFQHDIVKIIAAYEATQPDHEPDPTPTS